MVAPLLVSLAGCSGTHGRTLPTCTAPEYVVTMRSGGPRPDEDIPLELEGEALYYSGGRSIFTVAGGEPTQIAATPTGESFDPPLRAFWVEPTRFVLASPDAVWSSQRDGSPATRIATLPGNLLGIAFGRDGSNVYVAALDFDTVRFLRVPLSGAAPTDLGAVRSMLVFAPLYVGATQVHAHLETDGGDAIVAVAKDGSGVTPATLDVPHGTGDTVVVGFDGDAFFVTPNNEPGVTEVYRVMPGGARETAWIDGDLSLELSLDSVAAVTGAAYAVGAVHAGPSIPAAGVVRLARDGSPAGVLACDSNTQVLYARPAISAQSVYAFVHDFGTGTGWGIAR